MIKILIATPTHEKEHIFKEHLNSIRNLKKPDNVQLDKIYILHNCENLKDLLNKDNEIVIIHNDNVDYFKNELTHNWDFKNFKSVVNFKNYFIEYALKNQYDYIFYIDSDLILHKNSLISLLNADKDMISNIFWTKWNPETPEEPNAWDYDHYTFLNDTMEKLKEKNYIQVGMTGACTLIKRKVLESGINWNPIYNLSYSLWEDRAFCVKVAINNFEIWTDTHYPALHLYRESEYQKYIESRGKNE